MSTTLIEAIRKTVLVDFAPPEAFDLFTTKIASWWPVRTHSYGGDGVKNLILESRVGGRLYEITDEGEQDWGTVLAWEPPGRLVLDWQIGTAAGTEVEVTFTPEGPGSRVVLEHRGFEALDPRDRYESGWDIVLAPYVETASKND
ncbi:MAG: SRPBCC domain-containing protein [Gaiellaceae bacterium]